MIVALLHCTDPLGLAAGGHPPTAYIPTAQRVLAELDGGGGTDELLPFFVEAGDRVAAVHAFVRTTCDWWESRDSRRRFAGPGGDR